MGANNILRLDRKDCTGCGACYNICPVDAISMQRVVDEGKCTNCGLCSRACAALNPSFVNAKNPACYAVWAEDEIRKVSSSGGMFSLVADYILDKGGYVCGAAYSDDYMSVHHIIISDKADLPRLRGSKYVQSDTGTVYKELRALLDAGKDVLFTGCPCQVAGIYAFLGKEYEKLITLDIVCHGVPSLKVYRKYLEEKSHGKSIEKVDFRAKDKYGWTKSSTILFKDGSIHQNHWADNWYKGFSRGLINRTVCGHCVYATIPRQGDLTIADFWQIDKYNPEYDDQLGTSCILINNERGRDVFDQLKSKMKLCEPVPLEVAKKGNGQLHVPHTHHPERAYFFNHLDSYGYDKAVEYAAGDRYDVGFVGWWYGKNYGSALTNFALHETIRSLGYTVLMLEWPLLKKPTGGPPETFIRRFANKHYRMSKRLTYGELRELNHYCDTFVLGSDQLWNYYSTKDNGQYFQLDFVDDDKKKIAYATSFGHAVSFFKGEIWKRTAFHMQRFDAISVREADGVRLCKEEFGIEADCLLDPVFICNMDSYEKVLKDADAQEEEEYLFAYILTPTAEKGEALQFAARRLGLKLVVVLDGQTPLEKNKNALGLSDVKENVTVENWLYYIKNSKLVVTDSFHGTCFSILFKKPFICIANAARGLSRFTTLLNMLGLEERMIYKAREIMEHSFSQEIDYGRVFEILEREKARSLKWLKDALEAPKAPRPSAYDILSRENDALRERIDKLNGELDTIKKALKLQKEAAKPKPKSQKKSKTAKFRASLKKNGLRATLRRTVRHLQKRK